MLLFEDSYRIQPLPTLPIKRGLLNTIYPFYITKFLEVHNTISYILTFQSKWLVLLIGGNDIVEGKQRVFIVEPINNIDYPELNVKQISQHNGTIFIIKSCPFLPRFCLFKSYERQTSIFDIRIYIKNLI
ncbi:hypothetical protein RCL_jg21656.t2 [Rhizophagus clarus]|uniref:Uncharacterized protein n=1 Tax=Rhizophagus clarus TaxID=94130 RepID=A0A8H3QJB9_9GLOM|nr:hypothetical protein RCL_jg21656.t2 [Rhizophagus clarus]